MLYIPNSEDEISKEVVITSRSIYKNDFLEMTFSEMGET